MTDSIKGPILLIMRLGLIFSVFLSALPARAESATSENLLWTVLNSYVRPTDKTAVEASTEPAEKGAKLARVQADLSLIAESFEAFGDPGQVDPVLDRIRPAADPTLRPFFKTRETSLDAVYRTLAVVDFTWAQRFPEPPCSPLEARRKLLRSADGLFTDPETQALSPWMSNLLGPAAIGQGIETALDNASESTGLTPTEYARLRARTKRISDALEDSRAEGKERARLYCLRAETYSGLARAQRAAFSSLTTASRRIVPENKSDIGEAILLLAAPDEGANLRTRGAAVQIETVAGPRILTDAKLTLGDDGRPRDSLMVFARLGSSPQRLFIERMDRNLGLALGHVENPGRTSVRLAEHSSRKEDFVFAVGHPTRAGPWTKTSGLVTAADDESFQTDASLDSGFAGGGVLNENKELTGILVSRIALAPDGQSGDWPIAVSAEAIREFLAGNSSSNHPPTIVIKESGTSTILTAVRPFDGRLTPVMPINSPIPVLVPYSYTPASISIPEGKCVDTRGCDFPAPSRSLGSYYSGGGSTPEAEMGKALADLALVTVFKGIPALFRKISGLFAHKAEVPKMKPSFSQSSVTAQPKLPPIKEIQPKLAPIKKETPKLTGMTLEATPTVTASGKTVTLMAHVTLNDPEASRAGIVVRFTANPESRVHFNGEPRAKTDAAGNAPITVTLRYDHGVRPVKTGDMKAVFEKSKIAQDELNEETRAAQADASSSTDSTEPEIGASMIEPIEFEAGATLVTTLAAKARFVSPSESAIAPKKGKRRQLCEVTPIVLPVQIINHDDEIPPGPPTFLFTTRCIYLCKYSGKQVIQVESDKGQPVCPLKDEEVPD